MNFTGIGLAGAVALLWGVADTIAAVAARRIGTMRTSLLTQAGGLITLALVGVLLGGQVSLDGLSPTALIQSILIGVLLGIVSSGAYFGLYNSLERGSLVIVSPVIGGQGAVTLVLAVCFLHDRLDLIHLLLLVVILLGIILTSTNANELLSQGRHLSAWLSVGVRYALVAMLSFGVLSFGLGAAATRIPGWYLVLFWSRLFGLFFLAITSLVSVSPRSSAGDDLHRAWVYLLAASGGSVEVGGYIAFVFAARLVSTAVAGVCASLVPLIPLLVGVFAYRERVAFNQLIGIALALGGLIALPLDGGQVKWLLVAVVVVALVGTVVYLVVRLVRARVRSETTLVQQLQPWSVPVQEEVK